MQIVAELVLVFAVMLSVKWGADAFGMIGAGSLAMWCAIVVATWLLRRRSASWRGLGLAWPRGFKAWRSTVGWALLAIVSVAAAMGLVIEPVTSALGLETPASAADRFQPLIGHPGRFAVYLVVVIWIGAALGEELQMRGFVLNRLADLFGRRKLGWGAAIALQSVIFGCLHAYQGLHGIIATGVISVILSLVYLASGRRLAPVVLAHGMLDTIILTALYLNGGVVS